MNVDRLFLVKTIGDEFWYVYEVDNEDVGDLRRTASMLMDVVLGTLRKGLSIALPSRPVAHFEKGAPEADANSIKFAPPLKGTMDLLTNVVELDIGRYDHLPRTLVGPEEGSAQREQQNRRDVSLSNRLELAPQR